MNVKMLNCITASALLLAAVYPLYSAAAGKGEKCPSARTLSASEKGAVRDIMATVRKSMPPVPEGWTSREPEPCGAVPGSVCDAPGFPLAVSCQVSLTNEKKILESIQKFERSRSPARMERLAAELSDAAEKGDSKKRQKIQEELDGLTAAPAGMITARIMVRINSPLAAGNIRGGEEYRLAGTQYAYLVDEKKGKRLVLYLGRWNRKGEYGVYAEPDRGAPNVSVQFIEVIVEGEIAEQLAKALDLKALGSLVR